MMQRQIEKLDLEPRLSDPDAVFRKLIEAHRGLRASESADLNIRILLILANQLGQDNVVCAAIDTARAQVVQEATDGSNKGAER